MQPPSSSSPPLPPVRYTWPSIPTTKLSGRRLAGCPVTICGGSFGRRLRRRSCRSRNRSRSCAGAVQWRRRDTVWGGRLRKRFCNIFLLLAWAAWQLQFSPAACGTLRKHVTKPFPQPAAPDCRHALAATRRCNLRNHVWHICNNLLPLSFFKMCANKKTHRGLE